jgi:hypothetical protein
MMFMDGLRDDAQVSYSNATKIQSNAKPMPFLKLAFSPNYTPRAQCVAVLGNGLDRRA